VPFRIAHLLLSLVIGAMVGAIVGALPFTIVGFQPVGGVTQYSFVPSNISFAAFVLLFTLPSAVIIGVPAYYLLAKRSFLNAWSVTVVGLLCSVALAAALKPGIPAIRELVYFGCIGVSSSLSAWLFFQYFIATSRTNAP
jgi:hypothetical protein